MIIRPNSIQQRSQAVKGSRRAAALVEAAISMTVICAIIVAVLDFAIVSLRTETLNHIAQRVGRAAVTHGAYAKSNWQGGVWGPALYSTKLAGTDPVATIGKTLSAGLKHSDVTIELQWPSGKNQPGEPVVVETRMSWSPMLLGRFGFKLMTIRGRSYQVIQH